MIQQDQRDGDHGRGRRNVPEPAGQRDQPGNCRGRDEHINLVRELGMAASEERDDQLGKGRGGGENDALGITRHEAGVVAGGRVRILQEGPCDQGAVEVERVVIAP